MRDQLLDDPGRDEVRMPPGARAEPLLSGWRVAWCFFFPANLIVPVLLGWSMCGPAGRVGLVIAVTTYFGLGLVLCDGRARWRRALAYGGGLMALTQLFPMAQISAGTTALKTWNFLSGRPFVPLHGPPLSWHGGFAVTAMTGGILLAAALICGLLVDLAFPPPSTSKSKPQPWDEL